MRSCHSMFADGRWGVGAYPGELMRPVLSSPAIAPDGCRDILTAISGTTCPRRGCSYVVCGHLMHARETAATQLSIAASPLASSTWLRLRPKNSLMHVAQRRPVNDMHENKSHEFIECDVLGSPRLPAHIGGKFSFRRSRPHRGNLGGQQRSLRLWAINGDI